MAFTIMHRMGNMEQDPPLETLQDLLEELDPADREHCDVAVSHESGWCLSAGIGGHLRWENVEDDTPPRHMKHVPTSRIIELWMRLAKGELDAVESEPWLPGYE